MNSEKNCKDEDQESEGRQSWASAAAAFPGAGGGVSYPTSSNDGSRARKKSNSVDGDSGLRHVHDRAKRALSEGATAGRLLTGSESSGPFLTRNCRARPGDALSTRGSWDLSIPPRIPQNSNQDGPSSARLGTFATPLASSVHGSHDEVVDNRLRITAVQMERANRELEAEWHKRRADHYKDEMIRTNEMTEQKMKEAKRYFQEQSMLMCRAAATTNQEDIARARDEADENTRNT